jgi:hypothetical protein
MKKIVLSALLLASISVVTSCKKYYSCECVTEARDRTTGVTRVYSETRAISENMKEKQAQSACNQTEEQIAINTYAFLGSNYSVSSECDIK